MHTVSTLDEMDRSAARLSRHLTTVAATLADMPGAIEMTDLDALDALHETACDVYDIATRELEDAREALTKAAERLTSATAEWDRAGAEMDAAARQLAAARKSASVVLTAPALMTEAEASAFRTAHDEQARALTRMSKAALAALRAERLRAEGTISLCGGPSSKDELVRDLLERDYPVARLNESIHVLHHKPGENWSACEHCTGGAS